MAVLDVSHPDIGEFVDAKQAGGLEYFNLSVAVTSRFMRAVTRAGRHRLLNPRTGRVTATVSAAELFDRICAAAWAGGDPGLLFTDRIGRDNPLPSLGRIEATNPCGEVPLLPYESCNLGSLNLARFITGGRVDFGRLRAAVRLAVRFLDDVIEVSRYPVPQLAGPALATLGIPYDSPAAVALAGRVVRVIAAEARLASADLAAERGPFPLYEQSTYPSRGIGPLRNAQLTAVAPTGTVSLIAGTTSGIEPMFALAYTRHILGRELTDDNPLFERLARDRGFYSEQLMAEVSRTGTARQLPGVPPDVRAAFVTALEIARLAPEDASRGAALRGRGGGQDHQPAPRRRPRRRARRLPGGLAGRGERHHRLPLWHPPRPGPHPRHPRGANRRRGADPRRLQRRLRRAHLRILTHPAGRRGSDWWHCP
jgi:ribonucleoside-diphosphate reductase alpha chain